jgi:hypothetical protein
MADPAQPPPPHDGAAATPEEDPGAGASTTPALGAMHFGKQWHYAGLWRHYQLAHFVSATTDQVTTTAHTFKHPSGVHITLIPIVHVAHPMFWKQCDSICITHESVLMEGRYANLTAPATVIPPRAMAARVRPEDFLDSEGWEPDHAGGFNQPYGWGVRDSPKNTVVHAADKYDYEYLPFWAAVRFNVPFVGGYAREKHCLKLVPYLVENGYKSFAVPWGAAHMPIFATMLEKNGFDLVGQSRLVTFNKIDGVTSQGWCRFFARRVTRVEMAWWIFRAIPVIATIPLVFSYIQIEVQSNGHNVVVNPDEPGTVQPMTKRVERHGSVANLMRK